LQTEPERRVTGRKVYGESEEFCIEWQSEENKRTTGHSLTLLNPTNELIKACRKAWNDTEGKFLRWKTAEEIVEEELEA
jgi:hypothetical protein